MEYLEGMLQKEKDNFSRVCNRLLGTCFLCKGNQNTKADYYFVLKYRKEFKTPRILVRGVFMTYKKKICLEKSMITSTSNQQMKNLMLLMKKAKARNEQELFVVEGRKMFQEVPEEWLKQVYVSESFFAENDKMLAGYTYEIVSDSVFKAVSDTQTPQGILCLVRKPQYRLEELLNAGKIIRPAYKYVGQHTEFHNRDDRN